MDQELVQYLDERFAGIARRFDGIDRRFDGIDRRFEGIDQNFAGIDQRFEEMREEFKGKFDGMRGEMHAGFDEIKRHNGMLIEDLRYQVQLVAEGFAIFVEGRYAQDQARIDERFRETHALIRSSYDHLNQRVENLERKSQN